MGYLEVADLAEAKCFRARVKVGIVMFAGTILTTPKPEGMSMMEYEKRTSLAVRSLADPEAQVSAFIWPILSNVTIAAEGMDTEDSSIIYQISQVWNNLAGVTAADKGTAS